MQALEFTRALQEIVRELKIQELLEILKDWSTMFGNANQIPDDRKNEFAKLLLNSNAAYERLARRAETREIMEQLHVVDLYVPSRVRVMLGSLGTVANSQQIFQNAALFAQFYSFAEQLRALLRINSTSHQLLEEAKFGRLPKEDKMLELELIEYPDEVGISPKRLQIFVTSISKLHEIFAILLDIKGDTLTFKYFDSGSGFLIGIAAAAPIIIALGTLLNQYWDKIRFYRYDSFEKKVEAVSKTLEVTDTIQQKVDKGLLPAEVGKNFTIRMFQELETLVEIGAMVPLKDATIDQRQLLTEIRNTKLLSGTVAEDGYEGKDARSKPQES